MIRYTKKNSSSTDAKIGVEVSIARLQSPVPDIKSSKIENDYGKSIHGL